MSLKFHRLVSTYELDPIEMGDYRAVFRFEVFRSSDLYFAKTFRYDFYRFQPSFSPNNAEPDSTLTSDEEILVREISIGTKVEEFRERSEAELLEKIAAVVEEVFGRGVTTPRMFCSPRKS